MATMIIGLSKEQIRKNTNKALNSGYFEKVNLILEKLGDSVEEGNKIKKFYKEDDLSIEYLCCTNGGPYQTYSIRDQSWHWHNRPKVSWNSTKVKYKDETILSKVFSRASIHPSENSEWENKINELYQKAIEKVKHEEEFDETYKHMFG